MTLCSGLPQCLRQSHIHIYFFPFAPIFLLVSSYSAFHCRPCSSENDSKGDEYVYYWYLLAIWIPLLICIMYRYKHFTLIWSSHCFHWDSVRSVVPNTRMAYWISSGLLRPTFFNEPDGNTPGVGRRTGAWSRTLSFSSPQRRFRFLGSKNHQISEYMLHGSQILNLSRSPNTIAVPRK